MPTSANYHMPNGCCTYSLVSSIDYIIMEAKIVRF